MHDARSYTYRVFWSAEDQEFVATVLELPGLSNLAATQAEAIDGMVDVVRAALEIMREEGREVPVPFGSRTFSGKLSLRIAPEEHRRIAMEAAAEGVSINQLIAARI